MKQVYAYNKVPACHLSLLVIWVTSCLLTCMCKNVRIKMQASITTISDKITKTESNTAELIHEQILAVIINNQLHTM